MPSPFLRNAADGPNGEMKFSPQVIETMLRFYMSKLSPADLEELDAQLTGQGEAPMASDSRLGDDTARRAFLDWGPTIRQSLRGARRKDLGLNAKPAKSQSFEEMFPHYDRLRKGL